MRGLKVLTVIGTRPEAIKLAPVLLEFRRRPAQFRSFVCATGQHRQMLDQVLPVFDIQADHDLGLMLPRQSLAQITARAVEGLNKIIEQESPDVVLVQGDTTTAFCGALAAYYHKKKVAHVEAGLRTGNRFAPFPEEINRRLISSLTDYHFAPTDRAKAALLAEGVSASSIFVTGNTVIDALFWVRDRVRSRQPDLPYGLAQELDGNQVVLVTGHRRPYLSFVWLMDRATILLTDSGGVQEEAPSLGKPVLVMRETTERPEGVAAGNARLVGVRKEGIAAELIRLLEDPEERAEMGSTSNPYGDGRAAMRIADALHRVRLI